MRNMSFMLTTDQMRDESKDVTRRLGWWFLRSGDLIMASVKCQGIKKGEKIERIHPIQIVSTAGEYLLDIDRNPLRCGSNRTEVEREGFPDLSGVEFVEMFAKEMRCDPEQWLNRIEFIHYRQENK